MAISIFAVIIVSLIFGASAQSSCGLGSMKSIAPQTMTFVLPTITATATVTETTTKTTTSTATVTTPSKFPFLEDAIPFPSLLPLPDDIDLYEAYKKIVVSTKNETIAWWYEGLSSIIPEGLPETPGLKSETLQAWRIQHLSNSKLRADWHELIVLGDFQSGDDAQFFYQAESGINNTAVPNYYYDGPVTYYISKNAENNTVDLEIHQPNTTIHRATIQGRLYNNQVQIYQTEIKQKSSGPFTSTLQFISSLDDVRDPEVTSAKGAGYYHYTSDGPISPFFAYPNGTTGTTHILGNTKKQGIKNVGYFPRQWASMTREFPEWFNEAGEISPNWTKVLTAAGLDP